MILIAAVAYFWLGGSQELSFQLEEKDDMFILGKEYTGPYNGNSLEALFFEAKEEAKKAQSELTIINYNTDSLKDSHVHQFIGTLSFKRPADVAGKQIIKIEAGKIITTLIDAHNFVMPKPEDVRRKAKQFADAQGVALASESIEVYRNERELTILFPLKKN